MRVFLSSTCYDLIDLRAEIAAWLRDHGFVPVLSDCATSAFEVNPDKDSIATCLQNVRASDIFVLILNQRYGPRLGKCGFENVSATHLEYKAALERKMPIHFLVRDRLKAAYDEWRPKKAADFQSLWLKCTDDVPGLLGMIHERLELKKDESRNWLDTFKDSIELKAILGQRLGSVSGREVLRSLVERGALPVLVFKRGGMLQGDKRRLELKVTNESEKAALDTVMKFDGTQKGDAWDIPPGTTVNFVNEDVKVEKRTFRIEMEYTTVQGHRIRDEWALEQGTKGELTAHRVSVRYVDGGVIRLLGPAD